MGGRVSRNLVISVVIIVGVYLLGSSLAVPEDAVVVNLALKEEGKVYVFSLLDTSKVQQHINENSRPTVAPFVHVFEEDGAHYVQPKDLKEIVNVLCGNYRIYEYEEQRFDGYFTATQMKCINHFIRNENTSQIGEQVKVHEISLMSPVSKSIFTIQWSTNYISGQTQILENCQKRQFRVVENPHPGERYVSDKEYVVVNLEDIGGFYTQEIEFKLDRKHQLLYIERAWME